MSAEVIRLPNRPAGDAREALVSAITELHTLISLDPMLGASPVRTYFVLNPQAQVEVAEAIAPVERGGAPGGLFAYVLVAYDFPLALFQLKGGVGEIGEARLKDLIEHSAGLQGEGLAAAGRAVGLEVRPIAAFDAEALKAAFFPQTQETVVHLLRVAVANG